EHDLVGRGARSRGHFNLGEEVQAFDRRTSADNGRAVERVAFSKTQLATDHEVTGLDVAGDVDALDIDASTFVHQIGDIEGVGRDIAVETGTDVSEGITLRSRLVGHVFDRALQISHGVLGTLPGP